MSSSKTNPTSSFLAPDTLMRVKQLELRAKMVVEGFMSGLHRSPYHGFSVEFTDYRQYSPGDDLRYLDWKLLARRDREYIKRFEDETNLRCYLLFDLSRSMGFGSLEYSKFEYARTMAASLAWFFNRQRDAVGLMTFAESVEALVPPRYRSGHLRRLMLTLETSTTGKSTDLGRPLEQIAQTVSKRSMVILISDLLTPIDNLKQKLGYLRARGHDVVLMRILDPAEINFDFSNASMFHDLETGQQLYVDPATVAADYKKRFEDHAESVASICQSSGIDYFLVRTDEPVEQGLINLVQNRAEKSGGQQIRQQNSAVAIAQSGGPA
ncbi:MAG: DUF58 domain-containing protein [Planctomycetota bacterium]